MTAKLRELTAALLADLSTLEETLTLRHESMLKILGDLRARMEDIEAEAAVASEVVIDAMNQISGIEELAGLRKPEPDTLPMGEILKENRNDLWREVMGDLPQLKDGCIDDSPDE